MQKVTVNNVELRKYDSIADFEKFINETPINELFRWEELSSSRKGDKDWRGTESYDEAVELLKYGADDLSKKLETRLQVKCNDISKKTVKRSFYDVAGFQASVPRYLQGVPTSMINQKSVPQKQKIVTLNKDMSYNSNVSAEDIIEQSARALAIVKQLEAKGYRVNLNLCFMTNSSFHEGQGQSVGCKIRLKNAGERLNVSKLSFVLVHPSMLRRMIFRWLEVNPDVTNKGYVGTYGTAGKINRIQEQNEYTLPKVIGNDIDKVIADMQL